MLWERQGNEMCIAGSGEQHGDEGVWQARMARGSKNTPQEPAGGSRTLLQQGKGQRQGSNNSKQVSERLAAWESGGRWLRWRALTPSPAAWLAGWAAHPRCSSPLQQEGQGGQVGGGG